MRVLRHACDKESYASLVSSVGIVGALIRRKRCNKTILSPMRPDRSLIWAGVHSESLFGGCIWGTTEGTVQMKGGREGVGFASAFLLFLLGSCEVRRRVEPQA